MKRLLAAVLIALVLAPLVPARAQSDETIVTVGDQTLPVHPLAAVAASEVQIVDITDTSARVSFFSTVPLACYLVYGPDEGFGFITNDPNMAAPAIVEHVPLLVDLEPDTEYVFRMQGFGEDGALYVSELYRFRTLPPQETATDNLLAAVNGATVIEVSSNFGNQPNDGRWGILNALDDNPATEWSSNGDGDDAYFVVRLDGTYRIESLEYRTRAMTDGTAITHAFTITIDSGEILGPFDVAEGSERSTYEVDFESSSLRFDVEASTGGNTGIIDMAAYGTRVDE